MIVLDCEQGGLDWNAARFGRPTCSAYSRIIQPKRLKYSEAAAGYQAELLAEWALGIPLSVQDLTRFSGSMWTGRGTDMEDEGRRWYSFERDVDVQRVGFMMRSDERTGGSPDGLVDADGGLDLKCLGAAGHMKALLHGVDDWVPQMQGYMYISGRSWWDVCCYHPTLPKIIHRIERDEKFILALHRAIGRFLSELDAGKRKLLEMPGFVPPSGAVLPAPASDEDALRNGTAPDPDILTEPEMEEIGETLADALDAGVITPDRRKEVLQLVFNGSWTEARKAWNEVMDLMCPRLPV